MVDSVAKCNNCGACEREVVFPQGVAQKHQIVRCMKCGLMYAYPRATAAIAQYVAAGKTGEPMTLQTPSVIRSFDKLPDSSPSAWTCASCCREARPCSWRAAMLECPSIASEARDAA